MRTIGLIAGKGIYPEVFIEAAQKQIPAPRLVAAAFTNETHPDLGQRVDAIEWFRVGQLGAMIKFFKAQGVNEAIMVGQISPKNLFELRPDLRTLLLLARLKKRNAETLFGGIADELAKDGIRLLPATTFLEDLLPSPGLVFGPKPKERDWEDAHYAFHIAKVSSLHDIGQSVVVRHGTVLAVEAFEGTNDCMRRAATLGRKKNLTLAKVSKPKQDFRFDVPVIGPDTIKIASECGIQSIVVEAHRTLLLNRSHIEDSCLQFGISLIALEDPKNS